MYDVCVLCAARRAAPSEAEFNASFNNANTSDGIKIRYKCIFLYSKEGGSTLCEELTQLNSLSGGSLTDMESTEDSGSPSPCTMDVITTPPTSSDGIEVSWILHLNFLRAIPPEN